MQPVLVSSTQPVAAKTGGVKVALVGNERESAAERMRFNRSVQIVGLVVTVSPAGLPVPGRRDATAADIEVRLEATNANHRLTYDLSNDGNAEPFVDAAAMSLPVRYILDTIKGAPDVTVQARWKTAAANVFNDCVVSFAMLYNDGDV